jgi:hypothetical protein
MSNLLKCETNPILDPYHKAAGQASFTVLRIYADGDYELSQEYDDRAIPVDEAPHGLTLIYALARRPDEKAARAYLESQEAVALVERIHAGHVVTLTIDASSAFWDLLDALAALPENQMSLWPADVWFGNLNNAEIGISGATTDAEITALAKKIEAHARDDNSIILAGVEEYLTQRRDDARDDD